MSLVMIKDRRTLIRFAFVVELAQPMVGSYNGDYTSFSLNTVRAFDGLPTKACKLVVLVCSRWWSCVYRKIHAIVLLFRNLMVRPSIREGDYEG
jgi:hypothetical protein